MALYASRRSSHCTTLPPRNPYVALFDQDQDHKENSSGEEEEVRPTSRSPKRKALSVSPRSSPELTRPRLSASFHHHSRQSVTARRHHHHFQHRSTPTSRTSSSYNSSSTTTWSNTSYYSSPASSKSREQPSSSSSSRLSRATHLMPAQPNATSPLPHINVHSDLSRQVPAAVATTPGAPVASCSEDFRFSSCAPLSSHLNVPPEGAVNDSPSFRACPASRSRGSVLASSSSSGFSSSSSSSGSESESELESVSETKIKRRKFRRTPSSSSSICARRQSPQDHPSSPVFILHGHHGSRSHTHPHAHTHLPKQPQPSPANSASGLSASSKSSPSTNSCPQDANGLRPRVAEPPPRIASSALMCDAWTRRFGPLFSSSSSESDESESDGGEAVRKEARRRRRGLGIGIGNERWRELTRPAPSRRSATPSVLAANAEQPAAHDQPHVPAITSSAPASLSGASAISHTATVLPAVVTDAGGKRKGKQAGVLSASSDADVMVADVVVDGAQVSVSMISTTTTLTPSTSSSSSNTLTLSGDDDLTTTAATSLSVPSLELASYYEVATRGVDADGAMSMMAEEEIASALSTSIFFTLPCPPSADATVAAPATDGASRARSSTVTLPPSSHANIHSHSRRPSAPPSFAPAKTKSKSLSTIIRTELDISLSPLFDHILALCEHEHACEEEKKEAEEEAYRKSLLLVEEQRRQRRVGRKGVKQGDGGWWGWFGSGSIQVHGRTATTTSRRQGKGRGRKMTQSSPPDSNPSSRASSLPPSSSGTRGESPARHSNANTSNKSDRQYRASHSASPYRPRSVKGAKTKKHPITVTYGYRARPADVRKIFYSSHSSDPHSHSAALSWEERCRRHGTNATMTSSYSTSRSSAESKNAKWEWDQLFASAVEVLATPAGRPSSRFNEPPSVADEVAKEEGYFTACIDEGELEADLGADADIDTEADEEMNLELEMYSSSITPLPSSKANLNDLRAREFSSRDRKTKRGAVYRGRSASPLPRPPAWLEIQQQGREGPPYSASQSSPHSSSDPSSSTPSRPIRHPALGPTSRRNTGGGGSTSDDRMPSPVIARKRTYTDTRFFLVYALENSTRMQLLNIPGEAGDELRASSALGWSGSRAVTMVRKERSHLMGAGRGVGVSSRLSVCVYD